MLNGDDSAIFRVNETPREVESWFANHVSLDGKPYTLDEDQARAVADQHLNTLITARAGSGKTRVIVAKIAYLVARNFATLSQIAVFMFNRDAAAEVNQRISNVLIDGRPLIAKEEVNVASTFHKFALDIVKLAGEHPVIVVEEEQERLVRQALDTALKKANIKISSKAYRELHAIISGFITRAGQKFPGTYGLKNLYKIAIEYTRKHQANQEYHNAVFLYHLSVKAYAEYLAILIAPRMDFNLLMSQATITISQAQAGLDTGGKIKQRLTPLKWIMIDEYQDFSYLFFALTKAIRELCPSSKLFAVGDDWQAINRFAGSDVDYFVNFEKYFNDDCCNIPLATNYRSDRRIVENANSYMLANYNSQAIAAIPFSRRAGKIIRSNPSKVWFNAGDIKEDRLGDARFQLTLAEATGLALDKVPLEAAKLLKVCTKIIKRHVGTKIMLLHRHNFMSFLGVTLVAFNVALKAVLTDDGIMSAEDYNMNVKIMTMHKSKGLESDVVVLLEVNNEIVCSNRPQPEVFALFGDNQHTEKADQERLLYVALTRAKHKLYILSTDKKSPV